MIIDRILKVIELKNITKSRFYRETGLSNGFLDKVKDIGTSKLEHILTAYPDINPQWLITGEGDPFKSEEQLNEYTKSSTVPKNHIVWELLKSYEDNISEMEYFYEKTKIVYTILSNIDKPDSNFELMLDLCKSNIKSSKETHFIFFTTLGIRQEAIANSNLLGKDKIKDFLQQRPYEELEKECREFIETSKKTSEHIKGMFERALNVLLTYSELKE